MVLTSPAYQKAMRADIREYPSLARIRLGVIDRTAAEDASLSADAAVPYASLENVNAAANITASYATFEPDYFRLDGSQLLLPDDPSLALPQGWISAAQAGADGLALSAAFGAAHSLAGLTLTFGPLAEDVPDQLEVLSYRAGELLNTQTVTPQSPVTQAELLFEDVDALTLRFAPRPGGRARLAHLEFGLGYSYENRDILSLTEKHTDSPVSLELPSASLQFTLRDEDGRFPVDGDTALVRFLADGQPVQVDYGLQLPGGAEWVRGGQWYLSGWSTDAGAASFTAIDKIEQLTKTTYEKGVYDYAWHSVYDLAAAVLADAGLAPDEYYIDPALKSAATMQPVPILSHAAALQLLANLGRARLYTARDGRVTLQRLTVQPAWQLLAPSADTRYTAYSDPASVLAGAGAPYATFEPDYFRLDGAQLLLPDGESTVAGSGMTGKAQAGADGALPAGGQLVWYVSTPDPADIYSITLDFGGQIPAQIAINARRDGAWLGWQYFAPAQNTQTFAVAYQHITALQVNITRLRQAGQRAHLAAFAADSITGFVLDDRQPYKNGAELTARLRDVTAQMRWRLRYPGVRVEVATTKLPCNSGWLRLEHELAYAPALTVPDGVTAEARHYAYVSYIRLTAPSDGEVEVTLTGEKLTDPITQTLTAPANETGQDLEVANPLLDNDRYAQPVLDWVRDYYARRVKRTLEARGFPEIGCGDFIRLGSGEAVQVTGTELAYNGAFRETFTVRGE